MTTKTLFGKTKHVHLIGIGGIGMSGTARILVSLGYVVSGSDLKRSNITEELEKLGVKTFAGEHSENSIVPSIDVVVTSSAISPANPEIIKAKKNQIPIISRAEMLAEIMRLKLGIAIAGTHGKTTTTSLTASIFTEAKLSPTTIVGGKWFAINSNAQLGSSDYLISEADESDGSFLKLSPVYSAVTNIDWDHMDFYKTKESQLLHFLEFINKTPFYGMAFLCFDDANIRNLEKEIKKPYCAYGIVNGMTDGLDDPRDELTGNPADKRKNGTRIKPNGDKRVHDRGIYAKDIELFPYNSVFTLTKDGTEMDRIELNIPGRHNVLNALAAIGISLEVGIPLSAIKKALKAFNGVDRRMSKKGVFRGHTLIDDYGHHPTELEATLKTLRPHYKQLTVIFQPHRYSRTLEHYQDFAKALQLADRVYLADIYAAGEKQVEGVSSELIHKELVNFSPSTPCEVGDSGAIYQAVSSLSPANGNSSVIVTMGAGDIYKLAEKLAKEAS